MIYGDTKNRYMTLGYPLKDRCSSFQPYTKKEGIPQVSSIKT